MNDFLGGDIKNVFRNFYQSHSLKVAIKFILILYEWFKFLMTLAESSIVIIWECLVNEQWMVNELSQSTPQKTPAEIKFLTNEFLTNNGESSVILKYAKN